MHVNIIYPTKNKTQIHHLKLLLLYIIFMIQFAAVSMLHCNLISLSELSFIWETITFFIVKTKSFLKRLLKKIYTII